MLSHFEKKGEMKHAVKPWSSLVEGDEQLDFPTVKHVLNDTMYVLRNVFDLSSTQQLITWADKDFISFE